ncbi:diguanylate cyclase (GGDEF)-like protein/PAS domain S-box-containing protein [Anoxybacillus calidus]|uniref:Diguanylate cyclase (GGDEF)-like protein/PAS domain S-box-containing protein n=1 Tax=[Anoxybacillus] calidus TaxID=575178 RepID=A0A7V9YZ90_9BACL|nr:EAL domain-containing protein [Anoxybacillus calidus]MBA2871010.1 diguanylate cyclase (GGDEF)-like protein/PAS domain S-box-containing protein [Anoxybacillus calidus]
MILSNHRDYHFFVPAMQFVLDCEGIIIDVNDSALDCLGYEREELIGFSILKIVHEEDQDDIHKQLQYLSQTKSNNVHILEFRTVAKNGLSLFMKEFVHVTQTEEGKSVLLITCYDITKHKRNEQMLAAHKRILEKITQGISVTLVLHELARTVETIHPDVVCSILLLDEDKKRLYHKAAPSLPKEYIEAIDGSSIGPNAGSCGTAAFYEEPVIVSNIETDPRWHDFKHLALAHGLYACWSMPIFSSTKQVLGTFAIYHRHAYEPTEEDLEFIRTFSLWAGLALEQAKMKREFLESKQRYQSLFEHNQDAVFSLELDGSVSSVNQAAINISGYSREELLTMNFQPLVIPEDLDKSLELFKKAAKGDSQHYDIRIRAKNNDLLYLTVTSVPIVVNNQITGVFNIAKNITERVEHGERIREMAYYDALTGLPNRRMFQEHISKAISEAKRMSSKFALLYMDLDRFKHVNDSLGHTVGDIVLQQVAAILQEEMQHKGIVFRMGGDEFAILLTPIQAKEEATDIAHRILRIFEEPIQINDIDLLITPSIGIAFYPDDGIDAETLLKHADVAMYEAKRNGKNGYYVHSNEVARPTVEHIVLLSDLRKAIKNNELSIVFQPIINVLTKKIVAMEALVRWYHPEQGVIPPNQFIPLAEESGLIVPIGESIVRKALKQQQAWIQEGLEPIRIAVNVSVKELQDQDFAKRMEAALKDLKASPEWLELEITENMMIYNEPTILNNLRRIKDLGVRLSIDDFGTGYSSLGYLKRLDVDTLKIDQSFIRDCPHSHDGRAITDTIIALAQHLHMNVIAEGVENDKQLQYLANRGCVEAQGYFISPPLKSEEAKRLLQKGIN